MSSPEQVSAPEEQASPPEKHLILAVVFKLDAIALDFGWKNRAYPAGPTHVQVGH